MTSLGSKRVFTPIIPSAIVRLTMGFSSPSVLRILRASLFALLYTPQEQETRRLKSYIFLFFLFYWLELFFVAETFLVASV